MLTSIVAGAAWAGEQDLSWAAGMRALPSSGAVTLGPESGTAPAQWQSSLTEIRQVTETLLDTNKKLAQEYRRLNEGIASLETQVNRLRSRNAEEAQALEQRRREIDGPAAVRERKAALASAGQEQSRAQELLGSLQSRMKVMESRLALRRLKIQEMELDRKTAVMEARMRGTAPLETLAADVKSLKERIAGGKTKVSYIHQKMEDLSGVNRPDIKEARGLAAENARLKEQTARLTAQRDELSRSIDRAQEEQRKSGDGAMARRYAAARQQRQALEDRLTAAKARHQQLTDQTDTGETAQALEVRIKDLEQENKRLDDGLGGVRENIAVLDYKINTLEYYKKRKR